MGWGVLEPASTEVVQGSIHLFDDNSSNTSHENTTHLKHSKDGKIVLAPQPSDSPNDILNLPLWRRDLMYWIIILGTVFSGIHGPILTPITLELAAEWNKTVNDIAQLSSYLLLVIGACIIFYGPLAIKYGKRIIYIVGTATLVAADIWAARATSYNSMMGARCLSGIGQGAYEALSLAMIPDLFFVHERGTRVTLFLLCLQTGVFLGVPIGTQIVIHSGIEWCFGGLAIAEAIILVGLIFFVREPGFGRNHIDPLAHVDEDIILDKVHHSDVVEHKEMAGSVQAGAGVAESAANERPKTYMEWGKWFWRSLKLRPRLRRLTGDQSIHGKGSLAMKTSSNRPFEHLHCRCIPQSCGLPSRRYPWPGRSASRSRSPWNWLRHRIISVQQVSPIYTLRHGSVSRLQY
jgi:hypothetical protein